MTLALPAPAVKSTRRPAAADWPAWTDGFTVELGPDPADAAWHAAQNDDHHFDGETPLEVYGDGEPDWDAMAEDAQAQDSYTRGFLPL